jgi:molybdopterin-guanine dinucleotide biosynthesis protein A
MHLSKKLNIIKNEVHQLLDRSTIILAGGFSSRFGQDKGLLPLAGKPLAKYALDLANKIVDEKILVASSKDQAENYKKVLDLNIKILVDRSSIDKIQSPLIGALTGLEEVHGGYALLLPCDTPFVSRDVILLLFELCIDRNAVIPRWPNGYIEPLQAVYRSEPACEAARSALNEEKLNMQSMIDKLRSVRYVSTLVLEQLDPELTSFFNINTPLDFKKAENLLKRRQNANIT